MERLNTLKISDSFSKDIINQQLQDIEEDKADGVLKLSDKIHYGRDTLNELLDNGYPVIFTFPNKYFNSVKEKGLTLNETFIPGFKILAGTIGIDPYLPEEDDRFLAVLRPELAKKYRIEPRYTGSDSLFHGV